ncbi:MAG: AAA domain-containing protein [Nonlabens sp.]|uniref:AAA domain-containing protein n=1 Tax=Nonlabens sp. TaxID=1888209 RepID=UPI00321948C9
MKEILSNKLLTVLKKKLSGGSSRSIHLNAIPSNSRIKLQLFDLNKLSRKNIFNDFLEKLTSTSNLKFSLDFEKLDIEKHKKTLNRLKNLSRQNKDYSLEHGLEPFGFGYPVIAKRDLKNKKKIIYSPLLIWDLQLKENTRKLNSYDISRSEDSPIKINEVFLNYIETVDKVSFDKLPKEFLDDGILDVNEIKSILTDFLNIFSSDQKIDQSFFSDIFDLNLAKELEDEITETPVILNSGVFGLYLSQKESIISDIDKLKRKRALKEYYLEDYEKSPFTPVVTDQSQQQILSKISTKNRFVIHGPPGTGKSQTLTAILSSALRNNKTCLVVCEKKTALDVIQENLKKIGLGEFTALIEDPVRDRRKIVNSARDILEYNSNELQSLSENKNIKYNDPIIDETLKKIQKLQNIKDLIKSEIIDGNDFRGVLGKVDLNFDYLNFEKKHELAKQSLLFNDKEFKEIIHLFDKLKTLLFDTNPFESFYNSVNEEVFFNNDYNSFTVFLNEEFSDLVQKIENICDFFDEKVDFIFDQNKKSLDDFFNTSSFKNSNDLFKKLTEIRDVLQDCKESQTSGLIFKLKVLFSKKFKEIEKKINTYKTIANYLSETNLIKNDKKQKELNPTVIIKNLDLIKKEIKTRESFNSKYQIYINNLDKINKTKLFKKEIKTFGKGINISNSIREIKKKYERIVQKKDDFQTLKDFAKLFVKQSKKLQKIIILSINEEDFENDFYNYYYRKVLNSKNISIIPDNNDSTELYGIPKELKSIYNSLRWSTIFFLKKKRKNAISEFKTKNIGQGIKIEQLFSKRSSPKNRKLSLRSILDYDFDLFTDLFPIILTNPTSVSSLLPLKPNLFDIVLFDEASQLRIEDTVPSLYRAKVKIVSGDQQQMPPSSYFSSVEIEDDGVEDDILSDTDFAFKESLLEFSVDAGFENIYLDMHYRSRHPDLIEFSNRAFYNGRLVALPQSEDYKPIEFFQINGLYSNRTNRDEALKIVDYLKENVEINDSVGIASFNLDQRNLIMDEINNEIQINKDFSEKMLLLEANDLFIKNLENIQGDERDIIIITTTFGKDKNGEFKQFFGPINNKTKGHKLLNVIVTRAKKKIVIVSSIPENNYLNYKEYLNKEGLIGKAVFYSYLAYAKAIATKDLDLKNSVLFALDKYTQSTKNRNLDDGALNLSIKIKNELINKLKDDYSVILNHKLGGFTYDLCISIFGVPKLVIDLDGKRFYNNQDDYLFDLGRKNIAVNAGFLYYRIWSSNYYNGREKELNKIIKKIESLREVI